MTKMRNIARERQVVNRGREVLGIAPLTEFPHARPMKLDSCLLARSFQRICGTWNEQQVIIAQNAEEQKALRILWRTKKIGEIFFGQFPVAVPKLLSQLGFDFDNRRLPELIEAE